MSLSNPPKQRNAPDWRNTIYQFHCEAVPKYNLRSQEIAMYSALFSKVKSNGLVQMGNPELMVKSGIVNNVAFRKTRNRLIETGIITIVKKGTVQKKCTIYKIKLMGRPTHAKPNKNDQSSDDSTHVWCES